MMDYEKELKETAAQAMNNLGLTPFTEPVDIEIYYYLGTRRKKDLPNLPKTTCDALNGVVYEDDTLIVRQVMAKYFDPTNPRVEITVCSSLPEPGKTWPFKDATPKLQKKINKRNKPTRKSKVSKAKRQRNKDNRVLSKAS